MKKNIFYLIIALLVIQNCKSQENVFMDDLKINIRNKEYLIDRKSVVEDSVMMKTLLEYEIINSTNNDYFIIIDPTKYFIYDSKEYNEFLELNFQTEKQCFFPHLLIKDINGSLTDTTFYIDESYFNALDKLNKQIEDHYVIIKAKSKVQIKSEASLPIQKNIIGKSQSLQMFLLEYEPSKEDYQIFTLSINLLQKKDIIYKNLNKKLKTLLEEKKIKIFDGVINSNKIPIIIK